jgi:hypothetical protein
MLVNNTCTQKNKEIQKMKKILTVLMLLTLIVMPMFADNTADLQVKTSVSKISEYGFVAGTSYSTAKTSALTGLIGSSVQTLSSSAASDFTVVVRTNSNEAVNVKLYSTDLELKNENTVIDSIPLYIDGASHSSTNQIEVIKNTSAGSGLRIEQKAFQLSFSADAYAAATVGEYVGTVTMVVSGN